MKLCAEKVKLVLYVNDVLDKPIIISSGSKENHLQITIRNDGTVIRKWIRITWVYLFSKAIAYLYSEYFYNNFSRNFYISKIGLLFDRYNVVGFFFQIPEEFVSINKQYFFYLVEILEQY